MNIASISICLILLVLGVSTQHVSNPQKEIDDKIIRIFDALRKDLAEGNWILPPIDPISVPPFEFNHVEKYINISSYFENMVAKGPMSYTDHILETNAEGDFYTSSTFKLIEASGDYKSSGQLGKVMPINGEGTYTCDVENVVVVMEGKLEKTDDNTLKIKKLSSSVKVDKIKFKIHGLEGGKLYDKLVSAFVSDSATLFINSNIPLFDVLISEAIKAQLNPILAQYTIDRIEEFINNFEE